jgi:hypothetical protein
MNTNKVNKSKFTLYLICEGTSCEFVEKSMRGRLSATPSSSQSGISDYGLIESFYFNHNTRNTDHFDDSRSLYLTTTKPSCIDSALVMYAGAPSNSSSSGRQVHPVPYTNTSSRHTRTKSQLRSMIDTFGKNSNVNNYMSQPKYASLTEFLPMPNVRLDWSMYVDSLGAYQSAQISAFLRMISERRTQSHSVPADRIFLVCDAEFIVAMINMVSGNRFTQQDLIEHSSFWSFDIEEKSSLFGGTKHVIRSRHKLYPLMRNPGYLHTFDRLFYYLYKDAKVPLFQHNRLIPRSYLQAKYLTLCSRFLVYAMKSGRKNQGGKVDQRKRQTNSMPKSSLGKLLKSFGKQSNFTK